MAKQIVEELLRENAKKLELAFLLPKKYSDTTFDLKIKLKSRWHGRDIDDDLLDTLSLVIGDTICADVGICFSNNIISIDTSFTLFATTDLASQLIECGTTIGDSVICRVEVVYTPSRVNLILKNLYSITRNTLRQQVCLYNAERRT